VKEGGQEKKGIKNGGRREDAGNNSGRKNGSTNQRARYRPKFVVDRVGQHYSAKRMRFI
jgi:hypothetical protein